MQDLRQAEWLIAIANSPSDAPKMIACEELGRRGLAQVEDLAELRAAGMKFYEFPELPPPSPKVWIDAREFIAAAAIVAARREAAEAPGHVH